MNIFDSGMLLPSYARATTDDAALWEDAPLVAENKDSSEQVFFKSYRGNSWNPVKWTCLVYLFILHYLVFTCTWEHGTKMSHRSPPADTTPSALNTSNGIAEPGTVHTKPLYRGPGWVRPVDLPKPNLTDTMLNRIIIVPEYKLFFCYNEKVGCTMFNDIARALRILTGGLDKKEKDYQSHSTWWRNTYGHHGYAKKDLATLLNDPNWTRAFFYRDPAMRFLSAFNSKCVVGEDHFSHCRKSFGKNQLPFFDAIEKLQNDTVHVEEDPHFMPASEFCGGLKDTIDYYDFIRQLKKSTSKDTIQELLSTISVPEDHQEIILQCFVNRKDCSRMPGFESLLDRYQHHQTATKEGSGLRERYKDDTHIQMVQRVYQSDYDLFQLPQLDLEGLIKSGYRY